MVRILFSFCLAGVQLVDILDFNSNIIQYSFVSCTIKLNSFPYLFFWEAASCKPVSSRAGFLDTFCVLLSCSKCV